MPGESQQNPISGTPDPTVLTTEQLLRETESVKALFHADLKGLEKVFVERFNTVDLQFDLVERQRVEQKADTKTAVDAALQAQKEAVREQTTASERAIAKSEAATSKQLEQLAATFKTEIGGVISVLTDVKERVGKIENIKTGGQEAKTGGIQALQAISILVGFLLSAIVVAGAIAAFAGK